MSEVVRHDSKDALTSSPQPQRRTEAVPPVREVVLQADGVGVFYGGAAALKEVDLSIRRNEITALIGPSGCGKSSMLRCFNRMNDLIPGARITGSLTYHGHDIYAPDVDPIEVRRRIGMVFQKPNPFPKSIYDNVAYGPRVTGMDLTEAGFDSMDELVTDALRGAALWDEVRGKLRSSALALSGGQQQRLCIARTIAVKPEVILADEPCSALDPIATSRIEELLLDLAGRYTIVIVTHNMAQAARISDRTAFFSTQLGGADAAAAESSETGAGDTERYGHLVEFGTTNVIFNNPTQQRTADYIAGRFG